MRITFHGAAQTVTGSQHLVEVNGKTLLLDCGLYQGRRAEAFEINRSFPFRPRDVDAVILSHAHIDHSGNLPNLFKRGYRGQVFCTKPTGHLGNVMLLDSGHIQEADAKFVNKKRRARGEAPVEPIYTQEDAAYVAMHFAPKELNEEFEPIPGVTARLIEAGHILGSAAVHLDIRENGRRTRLWFSGDIGRPNLPLIRDPELPADVDVMIMESTYGDKVHRDPENAYTELRDVVKRTVERGGKVIIPAFAVGRTQEIVYDLQRMMNDREIPRIPVFVDSPLAVNVSDVFRLNTEYFDEETIEFMNSERGHSVLGFDLLTYTRSVEESKALNDNKSPMVIISASGMAETGRILHHLRNNIENPLNTILIVSWQSPDTLGRKLADKEKRVNIFGEPFDVRAEVATIGGLSAHAGQDFLLKYAGAVKGQVKDIYLVHGEHKPAGVLQSLLKEGGFPGVHYPARHEIAEIK